MVLQQILELCVAFIRVSGVRNTLVRTLLKNGVPQDKSLEKERAPAISPFFSLLNWAWQSDDAHSAATFTALDLLYEMFEVTTDIVVSAGENQLH